MNGLSTHQESLNRLSYMDLLNAFDRWLECHSLSRNAQLLYLKILMAFNRHHWPDSVQIGNGLLAHMIASTSEKTAIAARNELIEAGLVQYEQGRRGSPGKYWLTARRKNSQGLAF